MPHRKRTQAKAPSPRRASNPESASKAARAAAWLKEARRLCASNNPSDLSAGVALCRRAAQLDPSQSAIFLQWSQAEQLRGDREAAKAALAAGLVSDLKRADLVLALAELLEQTNETETAAIYFRALLTFAPNASAHAGLARCLAGLGHLAEALAHAERATELAPNSANAHCSLGAILAAAGNVSAALDQLDHALRIDAESFAAHYHFATVAFVAGEAEASRRASLRAVELAPNAQAARDAHANALFAAPFCPAETNATLYESACSFATRHLAEFTPTPPLRRTNEPGRKLRIGYVSPDFKRHAASHFLLPLLSHHDRQRFFVVAYASVTTPDDVTEQCRTQCDLWVDAARLSDAELAQRVRADGIDVLIDLAMHMAGGRPELFARRPAPVQVCWLAYPGTTGVPGIQYRMTDRYLDPPLQEENAACVAWRPVAEALPHYSETSLILPDTFWCYDPLEPDLDVGPLPATQNGFVTFGCLNNFAKVNPEVLGLWARLLQDLPTAQLLLRAPAGRPRAQASALLLEAGVGAERIHWVERLPRREYLQLHRQIDVALDPFPYQGHTASLDALWMGVPIASHRSTTVVGRASWSFASNLGLEDWVGGTPDDSRRIALEQTQDLTRLATLRASLRTRLRASRLMDAPRFAHHFEQALELAWQRELPNE